MNKKRLMLMGWIVLIALLIFSGAKDWLALETLQAHYQSLQQQIQHNLILAMVVFFLIYTLLTAISFPGASILTLLAGALFGTLNGVILVSFASTIGATGAFLSARYLFRDTVNQRFRSSLARFNNGFADNQVFYLLSLRLAPVFPFFLINLLSGLTQIRLTTFYWVSQLGMLPATIIYVHAGTTFSQITELNQILSLPLFITLFVLASFPLLTKLCINKLQRLLKLRKIRNLAKQRLAKQSLTKLKNGNLNQSWSKPKRYDRNLIVIGAGAAGLVSSYIAAMLKAKVTLVEKHKMGGDCLNHGCVPSKALIHIAHNAVTADSFKQSLSNIMVNQSETKQMFISESDNRELRFKHAIQHVQSSIAQIAPHDSIKRYEGLGVEVITGTAEIVSPYEVEITVPINEQSFVAEAEKIRLTTRAIIVATGSKPMIPNINGIDSVAYLTTDTIWQAFALRDTAPKHLVILGAGPIGVELAQAFSRIGLQVTLICKHERVLINEDEDVSLLVKQALEASGVKLLCLVEIEAVQVDNLNKANKQLSLIDRTQQYFVSGKGKIECDELLIATGRTANYQGVGLENLGFDTDQPIETDSTLATVYPHIYLAGDCVGQLQFTHIAAHQAWYASVNALFVKSLVGRLKRFHVDYRVVPKCIYLDPVIAMVGLSETTAKQQNIPYELTRFDLAELDRAITESANSGFIKILTQPNSDKILGVIIVGKRADDLIAEFTLAMKYKIGLRKLLRTMHPYPTWGEANKYAAGIWQKQRTSSRLLTFAQRYFNYLRGE